MIARHAMVTVTPAAWSDLMAARPDLAGEPLVADWVRAGNPLVARRGISADPAGLVPLGLPLPPAYGKRRIAVTLGCEDIVAVAPPPSLVDAAVTAPERWHETLERMIACDPLVRCFGSLAWQHLTGLPYLTETSDLDLIWELPPDTKLGDLLEAIAEIAAAAPMRIDGEVIGPMGGVNWRELHDANSHEVLLKKQNEVRMVPRRVFLAGGAA